ncbi:hypothetical protein V8C86DRAFT_1124323 [Haematococcus lacustris]
MGGPPLGPLIGAVATAVWLLRARKTPGLPRENQPTPDASKASGPSDDSVNGTHAANLVLPPQPMRPSRGPMALQLAAFLCLMAAVGLGINARGNEEHQMYALVLTVSAAFLLATHLVWSLLAQPSVVHNQSAPSKSSATATVVSPGGAPDNRLVGTWIKDPKASDPMGPACDVMALNGVVRMAVSLVKGIELNLTPQPACRGSPPVAQGSEGGDTETVFDMAVFSVIAWFKVREQYVLGGPVAEWGRRDLRRGKHRARAWVLPGGGIRLDLEWDAPHSGRGYDELRLVSDNELHVVSHVDTGQGRPVTYTLVYHRKC